MLSEDIGCLKVWCFGRAPPYSCGELWCPGAKKSTLFLAHELQNQKVTTYHKMATDVRTNISSCRF